MYLSLDEAKTLIINRVNYLVEKLIIERGNNQPPFLSEEYASLFGIKHIEKGDLGKAGGLLMRFKNEPKIILNINDSIVRQNFSCAHELGHLLFSELKLEKYINIIEHRTFNPQAQQRKRDIIIEKLCDQAATELLMPTSIFSKQLKILGTSIYSIERLAEMFKVSVQSAAIRVSELNQKICIVSKWTKHQPKSILLSWPKRKLVNKVLFSPQRIIITPPSILHDAYNSNDLLKGNLAFKVGKKIKNLPSEIKGFGYGDNRFIISLTFVTL
jgi:Zn-dependent peptidase ImmA (M78 family)